MLGDLEDIFDENDPKRQEKFRQLKIKKKKVFKVKEEQK